MFERHARPQLLQGKSIGRVVVYRDVTQRVQFEQKMMFNHMVVESSGPMMWVDYETRIITYANLAACELLGFRVDEVIGMPISEVDTRFSIEAFKPLEDILRATGKPCGFRSLYRRKSGEMRHIDATASLSEHAEREVCIVSFKDITEHRMASQESQRQQALMSALINSIPDIISYRDPNGVFLGCTMPSPTCEGAGQTISSAIRRRRYSRSAGPRSSGNATRKCCAPCKPSPSRSW